MMRTSARLLLVPLIGASVSARGATQQPSALVFPGLLAKELREAGNPLATYAAMLDLDAAYRAHELFGKIYPEVRCNYEEFLGDPLAGQRAMQLLTANPQSARESQPLPAGLSPRDAVAHIARAAASTRLVIFGEEHHLPQTRSILDAMLRALWDLGYRYFAAEAFTDVVMRADFSVPDYHAGYYVMDPVFASAVRTAKHLGYKLIAYDTSEQGPPGDGSFRDRKQAENLKRLVFDADPDARLFVLAGRGHAAEVPPADGWQPMASVLKRLTGIDPFTVYAPTMSQRHRREDEDPMYRFATDQAFVAQPTIFVGDDGQCLGPSSCDAYVFWPRFEVVDGRADWLAKTLGRMPTAIPLALTQRPGLQLVQAFLPDDPATVIPIDQVLLRPGEPPPVLMLPRGTFWSRAIDASGSVLGPVSLEAK